MTRFEDHSRGTAILRLAPRWMSRETADAHLARLLDEVSWGGEELRLFGRVHAVPRLVAWEGDPGATYRYSGREHTASGWTPVVRELRDALERELPGRRFDSVLLNLYRDGNDAMGWHADDEPELGPEPVIASISLGAERPLRLRRKGGDGTETMSLDLPHGSLLVMSGTTQAQWQHCLPRRKRIETPRVNLTFRRVGNTG